MLISTDFFAGTVKIFHPFLYSSVEMCPSNSLSNKETHPFFSIFSVPFFVLRKKIKPFYRDVEIFNKMPFFISNS